MIKRPEHVGDAIEILDSGLQIGRFGDYVLYSAYQPIHEVSDGVPGDMVAFEALMRPFRNGVAVSPGEFFKSVTVADRLFIECMCQALHVRNYRHAKPSNKALFINVNPASYTSIEMLEREFGYFIDRLPKYGLPPKSAVFELLETAPYSDIILHRLRNIVSDHGIRFALDDFGQEYSNFRRYLELKPDIVKLDRKFFEDSCKHAATRSLLRTMLSRFHDDGASVIVEGIETAAQLETAIELRADMLQGYLLEQPQILPHQFGYAPEQITREYEPRAIIRQTG